MSVSAGTRLGPFTVDGQGMLSPATPTSFPRFAMRWRNRLVEARLRQHTDDNQGTLDLTTVAGRVPSTAAAECGDARETALTAVRELLRMMPDGWMLRLAPDHTVLVEASSSLTLPVSAIGLVTQLSMFVLTLQPYLDVLDAEGLGFGTAKT